MKLILAFLFLVLSLPVKAGEIYESAPEILNPITVFVVERKLDADLIVYRTDNPAASKGHDELWCYTHEAGTGHVNVKYVDAPFKADVKVYFTNFQMEAKWQHPENKFRGQFE